MPALRGSRSITFSQEIGTVGAGNEECLTMPCGFASSSTRSISGCESRVFKRNGNHSEPRAGIDQLDVLGSVGEKKGKAVSKSEALLSKPSRYAFNTPVKLPKGYVIPLGSKRRLSGIVAGSATK